MYSHFHLDLYLEIFVVWVKHIEVIWHKPKVQDCAGQDQPLCRSGPITLGLSCSSLVMRRWCSSRMAHPVSLILQQGWNFWFSKRIDLTPSVCWQEALPSERVETKCGEKKPEVNPLAEVDGLWAQLQGLVAYRMAEIEISLLEEKNHFPSWIPTSTFYSLPIFQSTKHCRQ